jgi:thiol-disulfide isomerase/thioredoxin
MTLPTLAGVLRGCEWLRCGRICQTLVILVATAAGSAASIGMVVRAASNTASSLALQSLLGAQHWLNTSPLRAEDIGGKVILVNFWTYSCINSLRALPYVRAWADKYKDRGLLTVGVHTPEFGFEKDIANVRQATGWYGVGYPVVTDNDYGAWRAFHNDGWPAFHFIGADGRVRHRMLGEGDYDQSERLIQQLLSEIKGSPVVGDIAAVAGEGAEAAPDEGDMRTPETYVGYAQARNFSSPGGFQKDVPSLYRAPSALPLNQWALSGTWTVGPEFAASTQSSSGIAYRFHARDLHLVMAPPSGGQPVRFRVKLDGASPGDDHGIDVDANGMGTVKEPRLHQLIRQTHPVRDRTLEIEFLDLGVLAYVFTFG